MALPLLPLAILGAGGFMLFRGMRAPAGRPTYLQPPKGSARASTFEVRKLDPVVKLVRDLGMDLVGHPVGPAVKYSEMNYYAQSFQRPNGERTVVIQKDGGDRAFLVRGGFYKIYAGREKMFGIPTSNERKVGREQTRLGGKNYRITRQDFTNGYMTFDYGTGRSKGYWLPGGPNGAKFVVADTKPRRPAWYESAWDAIVEETTIGDVAFGGILAAEIVLTVAACVPPWAIATCAPAVGMAVTEAYPLACKARGVIDDTRGKEGFTGGICKNKLVATLAGTAGSAAEGDTEPEGAESVDGLEGLASLGIYIR